MPCEKNIYRVAHEQTEAYIKANTLPDGTLNYRAAIQAAIDEAFANGGGTVVLEKDKAYRSACLVLRSHVELHFENGAELCQIPGTDGYTQYRDGSYEPWEPLVGHNQFREGIIWDHTWLANLPFLYAPEGTKNVKITGCGTIRMDSSVGCADTVHVMPIGFYRVDSFEISDITICDYHSYAMMIFTCANGLIRNVTVRDYKCHNNDGLSLSNSHDIRVTGCHFNSGDDSCYIFSSFDDNRGHNTWWSSERPEPSHHIEIDHNDFVSDRCKAFGFILWGYGCPDPELVEVRDISVHDNHFATMGIWYRTRGIPPVSHIRFWNNRVDAIEDSFFKVAMNDVNFYHSMRQNLNPCFNEGRTFWTLHPNTNPDSVGVCRDKATEGRPFGYLCHLDQGVAELYQGVYLESGYSNTVRIEAKTGGNVCHLFIRDTDSGEIIAEKEFSHADWSEEKLVFTAPKNANYQIGIASEGKSDDFVRICNLDLRGNCDGAFGYDRCDRDDKTDILHYFYDTEESKLQGVKPHV